jgi:hypothetical protein
MYLLLQCANWLYSSITVCIIFHLFPSYIDSLNTTCNPGDDDARDGNDDDDNGEVVYNNRLPGTPLSERIAVLNGQLPLSHVKHTPMSLRCASRARAAVIQERTASVLVETQDEESPVFDLSLFPLCFQVRGFD